MEFQESLTLSISTRMDLAPQAVGRQLLSLMVDRYPALVPVRIGNYEPLRTAFEGVEAALSNWRNPFLWKDKLRQRTFEASVWMSPPTRSSNIVVSANKWDVALLEDLKRFMIECASLVQADFAYVTLMTECESRLTAYDDWYPVALGVGPDLFQRITHVIPWASIWSDGLVQTFRQSPDVTGLVHAYQSLGGFHYLQLTADVRDLRTEDSDVWRIRQAVRALMFGEDSEGMNLHGS